MKPKKAITHRTQVGHVLLVLSLLPGMAGAMPGAIANAAGRSLQQEEEQGGHEVKQGQAKHCQHLNRRRTVRRHRLMHSFSAAVGPGERPQGFPSRPAGFSLRAPEHSLRNGCGSPLLC
jgi:hypothetical protein